jgi:RNA polymerase sigma factor (sigma-70 family)
MMPTAERDLRALDDEELMAAYQLGSIEAFHEIYRRHSRRVYGFLKARLRDQNSVDDVFQAVFLKFHQARAQYKREYPLLPWLYAVCRSVLNDWLRKQKLRGEKEGWAAESLAAAEESAGQSFTLPPEAQLSTAQTAALTLRFREDSSFAEIARSLETSEANARQLVSRALRRLRDFRGWFSEGK